VQVREVQALVATLATGAARLLYEAATVARVEPLGMGDRVCVDLCSRMAPGEGMLVGNFCRALFLVHSEVFVPFSRRSLCNMTGRL
jgi:3-dehydroquinate synthase II